MTISRDMLATFLQVVDGLSVSHAADELGVGKSVVSKRVAQLEEALGATLFARSTRRIDASVAQASLVIDTGSGAFIKEDKRSSNR